jgi:hypothetical protein
MTVYWITFRISEQTVSGRTYEDLRATTIEEQRKVRALMAEAELLEAIAKTSNNAGYQNVSDLRYASLKRYLAKRFHPDHARTLATRQCSASRDRSQFHALCRHAGNRPLRALRIIFFRGPAQGGSARRRAAPPYIR